MSLYPEYALLLGMPGKPEAVAAKMIEIAPEIGIAPSAARRLGLLVASKASYDKLTNDIGYKAQPKKFADFILQAIGLVMNPQDVIHEYGPGETSNATLNQSMMKLGENPSVGGRKSRKHKRKHKRTHKLKLRKDRPIFAEELDKPIAGGKKHRK
jgi:hypothetical protein